MLEVSAFKIKSGKFRALQNASEANTKTVKTTQYFIVEVKNVGEKIFVGNWNDEDHYVDTDQDMKLSLTGYSYAKCAEIRRGDTFTFQVNKTEDKTEYIVEIVDKNPETQTSYADVKSGNAPMNQPNKNSGPYWDTQDRITLGQCLNLSVDILKNQYDDKKEVQWVTHVGNLRDMLYLNQVAAMKKNPLTLEDPQVVEKEEEDNELPF